MGYIHESLSAGEKVERLFQLHWIAWTGVVVWLILGVITAGFLLPVAIYEALSLLNLEMGVTNRRVIFKRGIIGRHTEEIALAFIENVELKQSAIGRMLGYAIVKVSGQGFNDVCFSRVADPLFVKRSIDDLCP